ncbi:dTDP-4-dehydrorhamnose reductase [Sphingosinithalassobacter sp. LHW66-3]|uniref:dTDP-4-dehydrorhamnose reductase n=1 Tax=Sphingosinithalassobacter sp. LHW66-3 TaxID=3424718 RepID=UPI003D6C0AC4
MRILVAGAQGQVASALAERAEAADVQIVCRGRPDLDLTRPESIAASIREVRPELVINAAAWTQVDAAEAAEADADAINGAGAGAVAAAAAEAGLPVFHLSTDYVFDGTKAAPYREDDPVAPASAYGRTKLSGERQVADANPLHAIFRTSWVYSPFGANFVKTMLRLAQTRDEVGVVADQHGNPTSALDIADALLTAARSYDGTPSKTGIFHLSGTGSASWADLAEAVFAASALRGGPSARVRRIATADYPTPARRPANSRLDGEKLERVYGLRLPDWRESVAHCVARLVPA